MQQFITCHRETLWIIEYDLMSRLDFNCQDDVTFDLTDAWSKVKSESLANCSKARNILKYFSSPLKVFNIQLKSSGDVFQTVEEIGELNKALGNMVDSDMRDLLRALAEDAIHLGNPLKVGGDKHVSIFEKLPLIAEDAYEYSGNEIDESTDMQASVKKFD
jgi:methyl-accepting chemotaxis protein